MRNEFDKWKSSLARTRKSAFARVANFLGTGEINHEIWEDLEALLVQADLGIETTLEIVDEMRENARREGWMKTEELATALRTSLNARLGSSVSYEPNPEGLNVIIIVGVNGSGKTTSIAKLGKLFKDTGHRVLLAAADTFRAAAVEQLQMWGKRLGLRVITGQPEGDPGAVVYDAIQSALARGENILLVDTAGRLHTRFNLMEELKKVHRVAAKAFPGAPHAVWLVMDATTGQSAIQQARAFKEAVYVTGIILAKLDSSARGGMAFAIQKELNLPILFAGLGEGLADLQPFDPDAFVDSILADFD
jgi:fused signal recognition particle receptor